MDGGKGKMDNEITVHLPDEVMARLRAVAGEEASTVGRVVARLVEEALPALERHPQWEKLQREEAAYAARHAELVERYHGQSIALHEGEVIDHDTDEGALLARVRTRLGETVFLMRRVEPTLPVPLRFPSFRWTDHASGE